MMHIHFTQKLRYRKGVALFIALVTASIVLAIGMSILNLTLKSFLLSGAARDSEMAFSAADAGMECAQYWNSSNAAAGGKFSLPAGSNTQIDCMGVPMSFSVASFGTKNTFSLDWGASAPLCTKIEVTKFQNTLDCPNTKVLPLVSTCTEIISRGYNKSCSSLSDSHTVERALQGYFYDP